MNNNILNETFQKHLGLLRNKLNEAKQMDLDFPDTDTTPISSEKKDEFWKDFKAQKVKDFVNKYGDLFSDKKFHAFISSGVKDHLDDEKFTVGPASPIVTKLIPTQMEIGFGNSLNDITKVTFGLEKQLAELDNMLKGQNVLLGAKKGTVPVVTFAGKYIIDGHHRWSKIYCANKNATVNCLNFDSPSLSGNPSMALKAFHLAIAKMLHDSPTEDKSGKNLLKSNKNEVFQYVYKPLMDPKSPFLAIYKKYSNLINSNLNEEEQPQVYDPDPEQQKMSFFTPDRIDPFSKVAANYIANNAQTLISNTNPATDTPRSHMPQTDRAPGYENALEKGELNFLPDKVTEKLVNETFQRHLKLLYKSIN